ncbi:hypothetical protein HDE_02460 [Halotydeus destructor]|nr:hypothetical protein HDE_02460 [Halotydeus destructor]
MAKFTSQFLESLTNSNCHRDGNNFHFDRQANFHCYDSFSQSSTPPSFIDSDAKSSSGQPLAELKFEFSRQFLAWKKVTWTRQYEGSEVSESSSIVSDDMKCKKAHEVSSSIALRRIILLFENLQFEEAANFIQRLNYDSFKEMLTDFPMDIFVQSLPSSLPVIEALFVKIVISDQDGVWLVRRLNPEAVVMHVVKMFARQGVITDASCAQMSRTIDPSVISSVKKILEVTMSTEPKVRKYLLLTKKSIDRAIEGLGHHGPLGTSDSTLMTLHDAIRSEFERVTQQYKLALQKLNELNLSPSGPSLGKSVSKGPAPCQSSHQRQLCLRQDEIQRRLIKNKTVLNALESSLLTAQPLQNLLENLQERIEYDKEAIFQFTQLRRQFTINSKCSNIQMPGMKYEPIDANAVVAPILMSFSHGCGQVLELFKSVSDEMGTDTTSDADASDISGYHSDSDSVQVHSSSPSSAASRDNLTPHESGQAKQSVNHGQDYPADNGQADSTAHGCHAGLNNGVGSSRPQIDQIVDQGKRSPNEVVSVSGSIWMQHDDGSELEHVRAELSKAKQVIREMKEKEAKLKERLAQQAGKMLERGLNFENICLGEKRPSALIRRYGNLYAQARVDTLDSLEQFAELKNSDSLKSKLLFSVVVLAFRSVKNTIQGIKNTVRQALSIKEDSTSTDPVTRDFANSLDTYINRNFDRFDWRSNADDVCKQIYATLYDFPCLRQCEGLSLYIDDCVQLAWAMTVQSVQLVIEYESRKFNGDHHVRFHASNRDSDVIKTYLWPALIEDTSGGQCVHKGVVIT